MPTKLFLKRLLKSLLIGLFITLAALAAGMAGYCYFEGMSWVDAFVNAAMILSGMGPVSELKTDAGKLFAGCYALFSGILFLVVIAIVFAPVVRRFLHKFHLDETQK